MTGPREAHWLDQLQEDGYCIIPQLVAEQQIAALDADLEAAFAQAPLGKGDFYGHRTKRFGSLLRRSVANNCGRGQLRCGTQNRILEPPCAVPI